MKKISVAQPKLAGREKEYVLDCLESNWISSNGKYIQLFENAFADYCQVKYAIATNNGTTALHLALVALGLEPEDEVLIPTVTYIATANAVQYCNAKPVLVDVCPYTLNLDPQQLEKKLTKKTKGIIPVHLYGHPAEMKPIMDFANKNNLFVVEDAAESHGAKYLNSIVGGIGNCAVFSFFGNKIITTGEGGMVTTNDEELAKKLRLYRGQGMDPERRYWFPVIGYNYRMTNIQAAIGLAQLENIETALSDRENLALLYNQYLEPLNDKIILPLVESWANPVYWMYTIFLKEGDGKKRDAVMQYLEKNGIETRPVFHPMHVMPPYKEDVSYPIADDWAQRGINLPTHQFLDETDVAYIAKILREAVGE